MTGIGTGDSARGAVFFDRDGVLNRDTGYLHRVEEFQWVPGAPQAVARVKAAGLLAIVVTNQSGIGRGYYTEAAMHALHDWMNATLYAQMGARIDAFHFCPFHPEATLARYRHPDHPDRKPNPGMLLRAIDAFDLDPRACLMIGDRDADMQAARAASVRGCLFDATRPEADLDALVRAELPGPVG